MPRSLSLLVLLPLIILLGLPRTAQAGKGIAWILEKIGADGSTLPLGDAQELLAWLLALLSI